MDDAKATIKPAAFRPTSPDRGRRAIRLSGWQAFGIAAALCAAWFMWFMFTAKSVRFELVPPSAEISTEGGFQLRVGEISLLRQGRYRLTAEAPGYYSLDVDVDVGPSRNQEFAFEMTPLPGRVTFDSAPEGARVLVDGDDIGETPLTEDMAAGSRAVVITRDRYQPAYLAVDVEGRQLPQSVNAELLPDWADVTIPSNPPNAAVSVDGVQVGVTPGPVPVPSGERRILVKLPGYKGWQDILQVTAGTPFSLPEVRLERADGLLTVSSSPRGASVTVGGQYQGLTPIEIAVAPGATLGIRIFKVGYAPVERSLVVESGNERTLSVELRALTGELVIVSEPVDAELWIDGKRIGSANRTITLPATPHEIELRKDGYAGYRKTVIPQPGFSQELKVRLLTVDEARLARLKPSIETVLGQELLLLQPSPIQLGASRREPGRRANEVLRDVDLTRLYYLATNEVTNAEFREFASGHSSGAFQSTDLDRDDHPVANVAWEEAALFCNWLSRQEGKDPFYEEEFGSIKGFNAGSLGYRLPTEAEWAWAARHVEDGTPLLRFPWGDRLPPPDRHGNYADRAATHMVGRIIFGYNDNYIGSAPTGTFKPNAKQFYDLGGNVAEWVHDYYEIPVPGQTLNPLGPQEGDYHVIRGSSWMHGNISELRSAFRDYGSKGRNDVGFRLARFAE
ncbi:MAG: PEGA domain-containing protein [Gammaproteobacteria bacterium]|nr:PEGA domain-containing protein [Gammaproteobacteria bacterium]